MVKNSPPKIAIVHDWLTNKAGAENVVLALHKAFPGAPVYTSVYTPEKMPDFKNIDVRTTYLQKMPRPLRSLHKFFPYLRVRAFRSLDLSAYDVIISSSSAEAKQVRKSRPDQLHICYCHTPIRYYWSHYREYKKDPGFGKFNWLVRLAMPLMVPSLKKADYRAAQDVDMFLANSTEVQKRIQRYYKQPSTVLHPPVDVQRFTPQKTRGEYFVALGRQVPYKRIDLAVQACSELGVPLKVFGSGSEHERLVAMAGLNVEFFSNRTGDASDVAVARALESAKGFIFPAEEDFGIVPVEAMAAGAPVIAYGYGGVLDSVTNGETGVLFENQTVESLKAALQKFETEKFLVTVLRNRAKRFDESLFVMKIQNIVERAWQRTQKEKGTDHGTYRN
jgi:glycosyltransferase involved in cell wall biosynthesis